MPPTPPFKRYQSYGLLTFLITTTLSSRAIAQIIPDDTLGPESSEVVPNGVTVDDVAADLIQGGALREENLFHSFEQFSIGEGQRVYFATRQGWSGCLVG